MRVLRGHHVPRHSALQCNGIKPYIPPQVKDQQRVGKHTQHRPDALSPCGGLAGLATDNDGPTAADSERFDKQKADPNTGPKALDNAIASIHRPKNDPSARWSAASPNMSRATWACNERTWPTE